MMFNGVSNFHIDDEFLQLLPAIFQWISFEIGEIKVI